MRYAKRAATEDDSGFGKEAFKNMTIPTARKRVKRPKTRTGCRTCRIRRVKCDEGGFPCHRCVKAGRICEGYDLPAASLDKALKNAVLLPRVTCSLLTRPLVSSVSHQLNSAESYAFELFRREALRQLPGSSLDWERLGLQVSYEEPSVIHAAMAIGFLHSSRLQYTKETGRAQLCHIEENRRELAFKHYSKAMQQIGTYIDAFNCQMPQTNIEVILLVCLLFFVFEIMSGEDLQAIIHLKTGLRILYEKSRTTRSLNHPEDSKRRIVLCPKPKNTMDLLVNTFAWLDSDVTLGDGHVPYLCPVVTESIPDYFTSLEEARIHLGALCTTIYEIFSDLDDRGRAVVAASWDTSKLSEEELFCLASVTSRLLPPDNHTSLNERMQRAKEDLRCWSNAFTLLPHGDNTSNTRLMTQIEYFELWLATCRWKDESEILVDRFEDYFAHLSHLAEQYIDLHQDNDTTRPAFPLGTQLVPCLAGIAWKCRNPIIRRRCIGLIRRVNLQGISDSEYLSSVCERVMELEEYKAREIQGMTLNEELVAADIPEEARILELEMCKCCDKDDFWKLDTGRFVYVMTGCETYNGLQLHEASFTIPRMSRSHPLSG